MENANGNEVTEFKVDVIAKDKEGKELGKGTCPAFSLNEEGLKKAIKRYNYEGLVELINRQIKTEVEKENGLDKKSQECGGSSEGKGKERSCICC